MTTAAGAAAACRILDWDSAFFGLGIGRAWPPIDEAGARRVVGWAAANAVDCTYLLLDCSDLASARSAIGVGFRFVDVRVTLMRVGPETLAASPGPATIRPASPDDVPSLTTIAEEAHGDTRFAVDPGFPAGRARALYAAWITTCCQGGADIVFVHEAAGRPAGYITCRRQPDGVGEIGLFGLAEWARGRGIGRALVEAALAWFRQNDITVVRVVTQGRNRGALRLYERCGFYTESVELWFHRWTAGGEGR